MNDWPFEPNGLISRQWVDDCPMPRISFVDGRVVLFSEDWHAILKPADLEESASKG